MKIRLRYECFTLPEGNDLTLLRLPKTLRNLRPGPPEFLWMRFRLEKSDSRIPEYKGDGTLAASIKPAGPIIPVRFNWCNCIN